MPTTILPHMIIVSGSVMRIANAGKTLTRTVHIVNWTTIPTLVLVCIIRNIIITMTTRMVG